MKLSELVIGKTYLVHCGWGDTIAKVEYIMARENKVYFKAIKDGFKFLSNGTSDIEKVK